MQLLVIRHAIAVERDDYPNEADDDLRPLTDKGRVRMLRAARGLRRIVDRPDLLVASPLLRAHDTAQILAGVFKMEVGSPVEALRPESRFTMFAAWAATQDGDASIAIVGHEPHLSGLIAWLMSGDRVPHSALKKGGACLLAFAGKPRRAGATLEWLLTPSQLRKLRH